MLDALGPGPDDHVVELAAGLGATARLVLERSLAIAGRVPRDPVARSRVRAMRRLFRWHQANHGAVALVAQRPD